MLALVVVDQHSGHNDADPFRYRRGRCCGRSCRRSGKRNSSNETIGFNRTKKKMNRTKSQNRQSVHDPVLITAIVIPVRKTKAMGRDSTTIAPAAFLPHSCRWSFVAIVHVVVTVASTDAVEVANSAVSLWWSRTFGYRNKKTTEK